MWKIKIHGIVRGKILQTTMQFTSNQDEESYFSIVIVVLNHFVYFYCRQIKLRASRLVLRPLFFMNLIKITVDWDAANGLKISGDDLP